MAIECIYLGEEGMISGNWKCLHPMIHAGEPGVPEKFCRKCSYRQAEGERLPLLPSWNVVILTTQLNLENAMPFCVQGTPDQLKLQGLTIVGGPYPDQATCTANCGVVGVSGCCPGRLIPYNLHVTMIGTGVCNFDGTYPVSCNNPGGNCAPAGVWTYKNNVTGPNIVLICDQPAPCVWTLLVYTVDDAPCYAVTGGPGSGSGIWANCDCSELLWISSSTKPLNPSQCQSVGCGPAANFAVTA